MTAVREEAAARALEPLRWGVLGATSTVARLAVLPAILASRAARLVAIATRTAAGSSATAGTWAGRDSDDVSRLMAPVDLSGVRVTARYQEVIEDPDVEAVYVPLPNGLHAEWTVRAAGAGKHVLCEKPLSVDPSEATEMVDACRSAGVVLAEAYMTPFHPRTAHLQRLVTEGALGDLLFARAAFTFTLARAGDHRWDPVLGGGALADVGVYCLAPLLAAAGRRPHAVSATARWSASGVDASLSGWLDFGGGFGAAVECSFETPERQVLELVGTKGALSVDRPFTPGPADTGLDMIDGNGAVTHIETPGADPYREMVDDFAVVARGIRRPARTNEETVAAVEVADELRRAAGARIESPRAAPGASLGAASAARAP